jgi:hypothetical protein
MLYTFCRDGSESEHERVGELGLHRYSKEHRATLKMSLATGKTGNGIKEESKQHIEWNVSFGGSWNCGKVYWYALGIQYTPGQGLVFTQYVPEIVLLQTHYSEIQQYIIYHE